MQIHIKNITPLIDALEEMVELAGYFESSDEDQAIIDQQRVEHAGAILTEYQETLQRCEISKQLPMMKRLIEKLQNNDKISIIDSEVALDVLNKLVTGE